MKIKAIFALLVLVMYSEAGLAKLFIEPYIGVSNFVKSKELEGSEVQPTDAASGFHLALRGGYQFEKTLFFGAEYFRAGPYEFKDPFSGTSSVENSVILLGGTIGGDFDTIRVSVGYFPVADMTEAASTNELKGWAARIGFGLKIGKKITANLDYFISKFDTLVAADGSETTLPDKVTSASLDSVVNGQTLAVSISFPIEFK